MPPAIRWVATMRRSWTFLFALLVGLSLTARADTPAPASAPDESQLIGHGHYINKSGIEVHSPAHTKTGAAPAGATARCRDGTYSFSQHHSGTCSHHRGVAGWIGGPLSRAELPR
jgi:hypothetical protein